MVICILYGCGKCPDLLFCGEKKQLIRWNSQTPFLFLQICAVFCLCVCFFCFVCLGLWRRKELWVFRVFWQICRPIQGTGSTPLPGFLRTFQSFLVCAKIIPYISCSRYGISIFLKNLFFLFVGNDIGRPHFVLGELIVCGWAVGLCSGKKLCMCVCVKSSLFYTSLSILLLYTNCNSRYQRFFFFSSLTSLTPCCL